MYARLPLTVAPLIALAALSGPLSVLATAERGTVGAPVIVIAWDAPALIAAAGGRLIGPVSAPLASLAEVDAAALTHLEGSAAFAVLDAGFLDFLCTTS